MSHKKFVAGILVISFLSLFYPQKTQAQYIDVVQLPKEFALDTIAVTIGKIMLKKITAQTVNWINSGFKGNPAYVTDPGQLFLDTADATASSYLSSTQLNKLCTPFKASVRLALVKNYLQEQDNYSCSLSTIKDNYDAFVNDFSQGGWDGWFEMTQTSGGNPYSAYFAAESGLLKGISSQSSKKEKEISQGAGFLSQKTCKAGTKTTPGKIDEEVRKCMAFDTNDSGESYTYDECLEYVTENIPPVGECSANDEETSTPGSVINKSLGDALGSGWKQLEAADEINEIVTALVTQLIGRVVGGIGDGLRGASQPGPGGSPSFTDQLRDDPQPDPVDTSALTLSPSRMECTTDPDTGEQSCEIIPGVITGPSWIEPITIQRGGQCDDTGNQYAGDLRSAMDAVLAENPEVGDLPNIESGGRQNARRFLALVETELISMGLNATDEVLNGNNNPSTGDIIGVWKNGDGIMERYDAVIGSARTIREAAATAFEGFIPLNCTSSGGGRDCGCRTTSDGGGETPPETPPVTNPNPGSPFISSITPASAKPGATTISITGTDLTRTVQFFDGNGQRYTFNGNVNAEGTRVNILVPYEIPIGNATVKVYKDANTVSNGKLIQISETGGGPSIAVVTPTSTLTPTGIDRVGYLGRTYQNGWYPSISPNGRYVAFGNWGDSFVLDLESGNTTPEWNFNKPAGLPEGVRCQAGQWLSNTKLTFICEITVTSMWRYEVTVGEWIARKTDDNPSYVLSSTFRAKDNHWVTYAAPNDRNGVPGQIVKDNQIIVSGAGGAISIASNTVVHACTNNNDSICVRTGSTLSKSYTTHAGFHATATDGSYITYGGYGVGVRGITPTGSIINLTLSPSGYENPSEIIMVNGVRWVTTLAWGDNYSYIILRPWGSRSAIVVNAPATWASTVYKNGNFIIAYNDEVGNMKVLTVPATATRHQF